MIRANYCPSYFRRFLFVFLGCLAFALWCLYDGLIAYPKKLEIAKVYYELPEENRREAWLAQAKEMGWPLETPKEPEKIVHGIGQQWFMVILCSLLGIPAFLKWYRAKGTWIEGDEEVIRNSKSKEVPIDQITKINKKKWEEKGVAKIYYADGNKTKTFIMDDFKYEREPMSQIMRFAEAGLSDDQIVGDVKESEKVDPEEESEDANYAESAP